MSDHEIFVYAREWTSRSQSTNMAVAESVVNTPQWSEEIKFGSVPDYKAGLRQAKLAAAVLRPQLLIKKQGKRILG
jgi:hypothetical protein